MTLRMLDSITPANLPPGADAYAGYADGRFANLTALRARFPGKRILEIAVFASTDAECADCETGDMTPFQVPSWVLRQRRRGIDRPVVYASASVMPEVLRQLTMSGITRSEVRTWSAHYGHGKHICGPDAFGPGKSCGFTFAGGSADGTQFTDTAPGTGSSLVDESVLSGDFFQEADMPITDAEIKAIATAVWKQDGLIANPNANPKNPAWTGAETVEDIGQRVRALQVSLMALGAADAADVAKAVLAELTPGAIAAAIGPEVAQEVVTALETLHLGK